MGIEVHDARRFGMYFNNKDINTVYFDEHEKKEKNFVIPTLSTHYTIQVINCNQVRDRAYVKTSGWRNDNEWIYYTHQDRINAIIAKDVEELSNDCVCDNCFEEEGGRCLQPYYKTGLEHNVFARSSDVHGIGLFSRKHLKQGDIICLYSGTTTISSTQSEFIAKVMVSTDPDQKIFIDSVDTDNFSGRWINHSIYPNARLVLPIGGLLTYKDQRVAILVECVKEIQDDEEIFIDYGLQYFVKNGVLDYKSYSYGSR